MFPDDLNELNEDELYEIMLWFSGSQVIIDGQDRSAEFAGGIKRVANSRMYYPNRDEWQVQKLTYYLPIYLIRPAFKGVKELVEELDLPSGPEELYYSRFCSGSEYVNCAGPSIEQYERYTVELFGLKIKPTKPLTYPLKYEIPDPAQYATPPEYWQYSHREIIQIWRLRIFDCPLTEIQTTTASPLSPHHPDKLYLEVRWHPNRPKLIFMGGFSHVHISFLEELKRFFGDAYRILEKVNPVGRPPGTSKYPDSDGFRRRLMRELRAYRKRHETKPGEKEIAFKMGLSVSTFKRCMRSAGLLWRDL